MEKKADRKPAAPLGFIGRGLGELLELKASCRSRLEYLEKNQGRLSEYVYRKLTQEYRAYLDAVDGEVELGLSEYEIKLAEIRLFANQLKLLEKSYSERLEELSLRHSLGEFDREQYQRLCAEHESKLKKFAGSLEKYQGQKEKLESFLSKADWRREPGEEQFVESGPDMSAVEDSSDGFAAYTGADESLQAEEQQVPVPETVETEPQEPLTGNGPPSSSLLELESTFDETPPEQTPELQAVDQQPPGQPTPIDSAPETEIELEEPSETAGQPHAEATMEDIPEPGVDEALESLPGLTETASVEKMTEMEPAPAPEPVDHQVEAVAEPEPAPAAEQAEAEQVSEPQKSAPEPLEEVSVPEPQAAEEPTVEPAEKPFQLEVDPLEQQSQAGMQPDGGSTGTDLDALMGGGQDEVRPESEMDSMDGGQSQPGTKEESGFDLENIFGASSPAAEQEDQAAAELEMDEPSATEQQISEPEIDSQQEPEEPAHSEQPTAPAANGNIEDELLHDLEADLAEPQVTQEPAGEPEAADTVEPEPEPEPEPADTGGGLDLDGLIDEAGSAATPVLKQQPLESQVETPVQDSSEPEPETQLEEQLEETVQSPVAQEQVDPPQQEEEPEPLPEEQREEAAQAPAAQEQIDTSQQEEEPESGMDSLVSMALKRATMDPDGQDEPSDTVEAAVNLDDGVELTDGGEAGESETEVRLTMNQTIDAIKKKTVKCPSCGTMNYAIRWYCESCESTLTAL